MAVVSPHSGVPRKVVAPGWCPQGGGVPMEVVSPQRCPHGSGTCPHQETGRPQQDARCCQLCCSPPAPSLGTGTGSGRHGDTVAVAVPTSCL